jgi:autotransporter-associated beta strand protein
MHMKARAGVGEVVSREKRTSPSRARPLLAGTALAVAAYPGVTALAADREWTGGGGDKQWGTAANWSGNAVPGNGDRALFKTGHASGDVIQLGANRVINTLNIDNAPSFTLSGGGTYSLTITSGNITKGTGPMNPTYTLDCDVVLGNNGTWAAPTSWDTYLRVLGTISDGGAGYGLTTENNVNTRQMLLGPCLYSGPTKQFVRLLTIGGANGALVNTDLQIAPSLLSGHNGHYIYTDLNNETAVNNDRIGDARTVSGYTVGGLWLTGNAAAEVSETVGMLALNAGALDLRNVYKGAKVELTVNAIERQPGASLIVDFGGGGTLGTQNRTVVAGATSADNTNGVYRPWIIARGQKVFVAADDTGCLMPVSNFPNLPASGGSSPDGLYQVASSTFTLSAPSEVYGLLMQYYGGDMTLNLGTNDLTIGSGTLGFQQRFGKTITSSGGRLIFGGDEIRMAGTFEWAEQPKTDGNPPGNGRWNPLVIHAPIAATGTGDKWLLFPDLQWCSGVTLDGEDLIGTYAGVFAAFHTVLNSTALPDGTHRPSFTLGGPSDRTINGPVLLSSKVDFVKSGAGTLTLNGEDMRNGYTATTEIQAGRVVVGHSKGLSANGITVRSGARLEVAEGIAWSQPFATEANATVGGRGRFSNNNLTLNEGTRIAPGGSNAVGTVAFGNGASHTLTVKPNCVIDWEIGEGTVTPGTDYDLLLMTGKFSFTGGSTLRIVVSDLSGGATRIRKDTRFTVAEWTGDAPDMAVNWVIESAMPRVVSTEHAVVEVNADDKKIYLSGIESTTAKGAILYLK